MRHESITKRWVYLQLLVGMAWGSLVATGALWGAEPNANPILARIDGEDVTRTEVQREVERTLGKREADASERAALEVEMLKLVIDRRLVLKQLAKTQQGASQQDVDFALAQFVKQLGRQDKKLADYLAKEELTEAELRRQFAWQVGWSKYLEKQITDENLQKFFEKNRRDFDGTQLRVAHILWKAPAGDAAALKKSLVVARSAHMEITAGKLTFAEAAKKYSQTPTASKGGDIGWIRRHEPMPETFSQSAFALESLKVSEPVVSPFGVHLIQVLEVKPGQLAWQESREDIVAAMGRYLFTYLAGKERPASKIELLPASP